MNLADIRRKAQAAEAQAAEAQATGLQATGLQAAPVQQAAPGQAAPSPEWQAPPEWQPPPALPPGGEDEAPGMLEPECAWEEPQGAAALPYLEEPTGFDPAALILKGRQSASGQEVARDADQAEATLELLCFRVATEDYAISIMDIKEIIKPREVTEVPRVPPFVRGILSLRGIIIPVFDMRLRLGLPAGERSERERVVVVKRQDGFCGVLVDQVVQVVRIAEAGVEAPPVVLEGIDREFVQGIGRVAGKMLILLDMEKVLDIGLL